MIVNIITVALILSVVLINDVTGASYSNVYVSSEVIPAEYYQYGTPYTTLTSPRLSQIQSLPPSPGYVTPCGTPCVYPGQTVAAVAPVNPQTNVITYKSPIPNVPVIVAPAKEETTGYEYSYVVYDENTGDHKAQRELSDGSIVRGEYSFIQPDGYVREVQYVADDASGFNAVVKKFLPVPVEGKRKVEAKEKKDSSLPCHEIKNESLKEGSEEESEESSEKHELKTHEKQHKKESKNSKEESGEKSEESSEESNEKLKHKSKKESKESEEESRENHNTKSKKNPKDSGEEKDSKEKLHKKSKKESKEESEEKSEEKHHMKPKHHKEESGEESKEKHHKKYSKEKSSEESGEESEEESEEKSKEKHHKKSKKESKENSSEESKENSKEKSHKKSKKDSKESEEESKEKHHNEYKKESEEESEESKSEESKEKSKENLKKKSRKESTESKEDSRENHTKKSKKGPKETSAEVIEVSHNKQKVHIAAHESLKPEHDIIRCVQEAINRANEVPAAMREEPSPLTYIILNKPC